METVGRNISYKVKGQKLTIEIDLAEDFGRSASGKTIVIASTQGNKPVEGADNGAIIGINCYKKP